MAEVVYVADDDDVICELLVTHLSQRGYEVLGFSNGYDLLTAFYDSPSNIIITDIVMPTMSGYDLCREIRKVSNIPIIMISANNDEIDRVLGLELGSDDYIGKPISFRELAIKVKNFLGRSNIEVANNDKEILTHKDVVINLREHRLTVKGEEYSVTPKEFDLLTLLIKNTNKAFTREEIIREVWQYSFDGDTRQVDHLIKRLRKKMLEKECACQIQTVWGVGYKIGEDN